MNTNQIRCFQESANRLSFTSAANELFLSPQAVSKQVIALEEEIGVRLFDRNGPRLALTDSGKLFLNTFAALDRQYSFMLEDIRLHLKSRQMTLSIGVSEWLEVSGPFMDGVNAFRAAYPGCKVSMNIYCNHELLAALKSGDIDCAIYSAGQSPQDNEMQSEVIAVDELMMYAPGDIPPGPAQEDCWGLPLLVVSSWHRSNTELRIAGDRKMTDIRICPKERFELLNIQSMEARMELSRCVNIGGSRYSPLSKIPGLLGHPLGIEDEIVCLWMRHNNKSLAAEFASKVRSQLYNSRSDNRRAE